MDAQSIDAPDTRPRCPIDLGESSSVRLRGATPWSVLRENGALVPRSLHYLPCMRSGLRSDPVEWSDPRHRDGVAGERAAIRHLEARGWTVLAHRFRVARHDIDIVARRGRVVAFVEVKQRAGGGFGSPFEAVRGPKRRELVKVARVWMDRHGEPSDVYRFDVIGVVGGPAGRAPSVEHLEDAFRPGWR